MQRHKGSVRKRRGATLVLVAVMILVVVGVGAFAMNASRLYAGSNELQTGADAAALRGAMELQRVAGTSPADSVIAFARVNSAFGIKDSVAAADVKPKYWNDSTPARDTTWAAANAVEVKVARPIVTLLGMKSTSVVSARRAIAWIANLASTGCVKPWGLPMGQVVQVATNGADSSSRFLTAAELATLRQKTEIERTLILAPPGYGGQEPEPTRDGRWDPLRILGNGTKAYEDQLEGVDCNSYRYVVTQTDTVRDKPGNNIPDKTTPIMQQSICSFAAGSDNCRNSEGTVGVKVITAFTPPTVKNGTDQIVVIQMMGEFKIVCYKQEDPKKKTTTNTCNNVDGTPVPGWANLSEGTLVGVVGLSSFELGGATLGTTISTAQRLILVK